MNEELSTLLQGRLTAIQRREDIRLRDFVGRDFVRDVIDDFIQRRNRVLLLVGPPGVGKTALSAAFVQCALEDAGADADALPALAHFCTLPDGNNPYTFCEVLATQLHYALGDEFPLVQTEGNKQVTASVNINVREAASGSSITGVAVNVGGIHPREAFRKLIREPLHSYTKAHAGTHVPLLIYVDALNAAWEWDGGQSGNIVSLLADAQDLPAWVNIVCTTRPGPTVPALQTSASVQVYELDPRSDENLTDIETFCRRHLVEALDDEQRQRFMQHLAEAPALRAAGEDKVVDAFVEEAVEASQGNFLFMRRYIDTWHSTLSPSVFRRGIDPKRLLDFENNASLLDALDNAFETVLSDLRPELDKDTSDADEDILAALASAFEPLTLPTLTYLTDWPADDVEDSLTRLAPVLAEQQPDDTETSTDTRYEFYHRGFADFVRRSLPNRGRDVDLDVAARLAQAVYSDTPQLRDYATRYRWQHLMRGVGMPISTDGAADVDERPYRDLTQEDLESMLSDQPSIIQAQLLRELALRELSAEQTGTSWSTAVEHLRRAADILRHTRALAPLRRANWRYISDDMIPPEHVELERTLIALGDAYTTIARRMDAGGRYQTERRRGITGLLQSTWSTLARLPLTLYLLLVILRENPGEIQFPGVLQNLGRHQDWTVARLYVLSVTAYRRARTLSKARHARDVEEEVTERLAGVYTDMGAYRAAEASYETLQSRPNTLSSPWRQALWRLELSEVQLLEGHIDRAIAIATAALPVFVQQQAAVQRARTLSVLAVAYSQQAEGAYRAEDDRLSRVLDDQAFATYEEALHAWQDVAAVGQHENSDTDPEIAIGELAHQLWQTANAPRMDETQQQRALALLENQELIPTWHFPQRFEHPLLQLFRLSAALLLPVYLIVGLLLAIQLPSDVYVRTQGDLAFTPPGLDLSVFPNQISGLSATDLAQVAAASTNLQVQTNAPALDPLAIGSSLLAALAVYFLTYTLFGLAVVAFSSPAQFQQRRPGRAILTTKQIRWRGLVPASPIRDYALPLLEVNARRVWSWLRERFPSLNLPELSQTPILKERRIGNRVVPFDTVESIIEVNRTIAGEIVRSHSYTLLKPEHDEALHLPGTLERYDALCEELKRRIDAREHDFGAEVVRSPAGVLFLASLAYALLLVILLPVASRLLVTPLPLIGYSLSHFYALSTPGLLLPLLLWFVARPLNIRRLTSDTLTPVIAVGAVGVVLALAVLLRLFSLQAFGVRPDLATPILAVGILAALISYLPHHEFGSGHRSRWEHRVVGALGVAALLGVLLLSIHIGRTLFWYNALVHGNKLISEALADQECRQAGIECPELAGAIGYYNRMVNLRRNDSDGYAFRGFAYLVAATTSGDFSNARSDFTEALAHDRNRPSRYANRSALYLLTARDQPYEEARRNYERALDTAVRALEHQGGLPPQVLNAIALLKEPRTKSCVMIAETVMPNGAKEIDLLAPPAYQIPTGALTFWLQLADTCYARGFQRLQLNGDAAQREGAWGDLAGANAAYRAAVESAAVGSDAYAGAEHGLALSWSSLSRLSGTAPEIPNKDTSLLHARLAYDALDDVGFDEQVVHRGKAWTDLQLEAIDEAEQHLQAAWEADPDNPAYPMLLGMIAWHEAQQYGTYTRPTPAYAASMQRALDLYSQRIAMGGDDLSRAYAARSLLYFNLRATGDTPADFDRHMRRALDDITIAIAQAQAEGLEPADYVGYRYWRGRLSMSLALNWELKRYGVHEWSEITPLYAQAYDDFVSSVPVDPNQDRREQYVRSWLPWSQAQLNNASHMQLARAYARDNNFVAARRQLSLAEPIAAGVAAREGSPDLRPDYSYLHGLIALGMGMPAVDIDFPDPVADGASSPDASYERAIADTLNTAYVPCEARAGVFRQAMGDVQWLLANVYEGWPDESRALAEEIHTRLRTEMQSSTQCE